jgi:hypothetical protein
MFQWVVCFRCLLAQASKRAVAGLESYHVSLMAIFQGLSFSSVKTDVKPSPKHDMFWCWFVRGLALPTHQNLDQTTSKQTMHLWIVAEITSRDFTWYTFQYERPCFFWVVVELAGHHSLNHLLCLFPWNLLAVSRAHSLYC